MDLQGVAHRRLSHAGRADGDDAVDHPVLALLPVLFLLALRRRIALAAVRLLSLEATPAAAGAAGMYALWLQ